jgi:hypothetical protein
MMPPFTPCSGFPGSQVVTSRRAGIVASGAALVKCSQSHRRVALDSSPKPLPPASVLVVFADHAGCPWLRPLRRGFRHCFVVLRTDSVWLACEPLKDRIELDALVLPDDFDLATFYCQQGHQVLLGERVRVRARGRVALAPLTCVTVVKRLLGIDAPWVWTPWQLYAHLSGPNRGFREWPKVAPSAATGKHGQHVGH